MVKSWQEFIKEEFIENSDNVIDAKMEELSDLISNLSNGNNIMYQWESKENSELIINFLFNDLSIRYEFDIENLKISKIVGETIDFDIRVSSIDEALDIIEKDVHNILGISEKSIIKRSFTEFIKESKDYIIKWYDPLEGKKREELIKADDKDDAKEKIVNKHGKHHFDTGGMLNSPQMDIILKDVPKRRYMISNESYDSSIKVSDVTAIVDKIKKISKLEIVDNSADIDYLIDSLESKLSNYDQETIDEVIELMLFNYPDVSEENIIDKIIELGDRILDKYGTEPKMVLLAFEDAFYELSKHFNISEKKKPGRPKAGRTKSGRKVPGKYLTKNRKLMKKEIEEFQGKNTYKTQWDADYESGKGGQGKRHKTKKSAATKAYQKMFGEKK